MDSKHIGKAVKQYRLLNGMTQEETASRLYLDPQYYGQLERGERNFSLERLIDICQLFHIGIEDIINIPEDGDNSYDMELITSIHKKVESLSHTQLLALEKIIEDIVIFIK